MCIEYIHIRWIIWITHKYNKIILYTVLHEGFIFTQTVHHLGSQQDQYKIVYIRLE